MANFLKTVAASEVPPGTAKAVSLNGKTVALVNTGVTYRALDNTCAHRGGPLGEGVVDGETLACPWHGWQYDVKTGECLTHPRAKVACYAVKQEGDDLLVAID